MTPRVLFVGGTTYSLPLPAGLDRKFGALGEVMDLRVAAVGEAGGVADPRFVLVPPVSAPAGRAMVHAKLLAAVWGQLRRRPPDAVVAESPHFAALVLPLLRASGARSALIVEVHGDWRLATRQYGAGRGWLSPAADRLARLGLRRASAVRVVSRRMDDLVVEVRGRPAEARFATFSDLAAFGGDVVAAPGESPRALFVGGLSPVKNVTGLLAAWADVHRRLPQARLTIVGDGPQRDEVERAAADPDGAVDYMGSQPPERVAKLLDESSLLVLPSRSEGLPRVIIEAFARARPVVASEVGGIPELIDDGDHGLLVPAGARGALADALAALLGDPDRAARMGRCALRRYEEVALTPAEYARQYAELVASATGAGPLSGRSPAEPA